jgi:hypothetical protein
VFTIFYSDTVAHGRARADWEFLPDTDVQVIVEWRQPRQDRGELRWAGVADRMLWTGEDEYDPFGWGVKFGRWMTRAAYEQVWERAARGH